MTLHYHRSGHGQKVLLAFHGIGQDGATCFGSFEKYLGDYYTIYAFDLFFHGKNVTISPGELFPEPDVITRESWKGILENFLTNQNISRFDVVGFSMGGRFAMATLEAFATQVDRVFLIAPDGITEHPLYKLATGFSPARRLFRWCMQHPGSLLLTASLIQKAGFLNQSLHRFALNVLNTPGKRQVIYSSWTAFRALRFDIPALNQMAENHGVKIFLFVGKYDKLLPPSAVKRLSDLLPSQQYKIIQSGHSGLVDKIAVFIANDLAK
ncbi:alpha/beta fold hydrolase [Dyadobacter helix]|nr:alpha/beta hydrolase [Dyadobacter sp. CECT 9275]